MFKGLSDIVTMQPELCYSVSTYLITVSHTWHKIVNSQLQMVEINVPPEDTWRPLIFMTITCSILTQVHCKGYRGLRSDPTVLDTSIWWCLGKFRAAVHLWKVALVVSLLTNLTSVMDLTKRIPSLAPLILARHSLK